MNSGVVEVVRNLKSEINLPILTEEDLLKLKSNLSIPATNRVIVAGSTRKGEEKELIEAYSRAKIEKSFSKERFSQIVDVIEKIDTQIQKYMAIKTVVSFVGELMSKG